ncbi:MAG: hypothetical protein IPK79_03030 [Vampirovibrionales bacterium]|nr:hypothetical protein [Vampirovibrionales bacterium]
MTAGVSTNAAARASATRQPQKPQTEAEKKIAGQRAFVEKWIHDEVTNRWRTSSLVPEGRGKNKGTTSFMPTQSLG